MKVWRENLMLHLLHIVDRMFRIVLPVILLVLEPDWPARDASAESASSKATVQSTAAADMPAWFEKKWSTDTQGTGKWIADNSKYKSESEPVDSYGIEYSRGAGKKSLKFRLYAISDNKESGTIWEYREFWHPGEKKVLVYQWGSDGTFGFGELKPMNLSQGKFELEQIFLQPDGTSYKTRHDTMETETERHSISYDYSDGSWKKGRTYIWRRSK